jgi:hypothetical protein
MPLKRALCLVYQKTKTHVDAVVTHEYVVGSFGKHHLEPGVSRLSDVVKIPGVRTVQSRTNISSNKKITASKTKVSKSKKQRKQSTERTR